jgi:hypothetical protein
MVRRAAPSHQSAVSVEVGDIAINCYMGNSVVLIGDDPAARDVDWLRRLRWCGLVVTIVYCYAVARLPVEFAD